RDATATATRCFSATATATTEIYTLSLHDALPISETLGAARAPPAGDRARAAAEVRRAARRQGLSHQSAVPRAVGPLQAGGIRDRSEEHTSELQSRENLVCRLLLEKKNKA